MATSYEEALKWIGTNETTTNAIYKAALDAQDAWLNQMARDEFFDKLWHRAMLILAIMAVAYLWRISQQTKKVSSPTRPTSQTQSDPIEAKNSRADATRPTTKPPLPGSPNRTSPTQSPAIAPIAPGATSNVHPDSRFFPKN